MGKQGPSPAGRQEEAGGAGEGGADKRLRRKEINRNSARRGRVKRAEEASSLRRQVRGGPWGART